MSLESTNRNAALASSDAEDDSYVDPILFAEGAYADQQDYQQTIDELADRINKGVAVPRGRENSQALLANEADDLLKAAKILKTMIELNVPRA